MSWFKVDDRLAFNAKVVAAGNAAMGLWVRAGSWCASQAKGGFVPYIMAKAMRSPCDSQCDSQCEYGCDVDALLSVGLWHEVPGGFEFHDWEDYQPSAEEEAAKRQKRSDAGKRGAEARWGGVESHATANGKRNGNAMAHRNAPDPTRPDQSSSSPELRPEVAKVLDLLDARIENNGAKKPARSKANLDAARLLFDADSRDFAEVCHLIAWATSDPFWRSNILSMAKFRAKYDQLKLKAGVTPTPERRPQPYKEIPPYEGDPDDIAAYQAHYERFAS